MRGGEPCCNCLLLKAATTISRYLESMPGHWSSFEGPPGSLFLILFTSAIRCFDSRMRFVPGVVNGSQLPPSGN